jgi:hypothetical protein
MIAGGLKEKGLFYMKNFEICLSNRDNKRRKYLVGGTCNKK